MQVLSAGGHARQWLWEKLVARQSGLLDGKRTRERMPAHMRAQAGGPGCLLCPVPGLILTAELFIAIACLIFLSTNRD
ncbi:MAG: hypothetical protein PHY05_13375 [Methanothrix sp.]|nr:hypothetical protein [Methanothrix sp.]